MGVIIIVLLEPSHEYCYFIWWRDRILALCFNWEKSRCIVVLLWTLQHEILATEKVLIEGLQFDLLVELPYLHLLKFIRQLQGYVLHMMMSAVSLVICIKLYCFKLLNTMHGLIAGRRKLNVTSLPMFICHGQLATKMEVMMSFYCCNTSEMQMLSCNAAVTSLVSQTFISVLTLCSILNHRPTCLIV